MADTKQTVTRTESNGVGENGETVERSTQSVQTEVGTKTTVTNSIWYIYGVIAVLLTIRFILKVFGANPSSGFVDFVYSATGILSGPFDNIFGVTKTEAGTTSSVFEPSILVAIAVYGLVAWGLARVLTLNERQS